MFNVIRVILSIIVAIITYIIVLMTVMPMLGDVSGIWMITLQILLTEALGAFLGLLLALLIVGNNQKRIMAGVLLYILFGNYLYYLIVAGQSGLFLFIRSLIEMSAGCIGGLAAILIIMSLLKRRNETTKTKIIKQEKQDLPVVLLILSIISVPTTYVVLVLSALITLGLSAWLLLLLFSLPRIPLVLIIGAALAPIISAFISIKAIGQMLIVQPAFQPALEIEMNKTPRLKELITEVCKNIGTQVPDHVILHAESTFYVTQGAVKLYKQKVINGRILAIGAPLLQALQLSEFKAILAHEFAHFTGKDTAYSSFVVPVYKGLSAALKEMSSMQSSEGASLTNAIIMLQFIPRMFLVIYANYFGAIDAALSRSRELRADGIAAKTYGANSMKTALIKVIEISGHYADNLDNIISKKNEKESIFDAYNRILNANKSVLDEYKDKALLEAEDEYDSHPSLSTRLKAMPGADKEEHDGAEMAKVLNELEEAIYILSTNVFISIKKSELIEKKYAEILDDIAAAKKPGDGEMSEEDRVKIQRKWKIINLLRELPDDANMICPSCGNYYVERTEPCSDCGEKLITKEEFIRRNQ